jgi:hypothetical protein
MSLLTLGVGLRGIISRRPFLLPSYWLLAVMLFMLAPPFFGMLLAPPAKGTAVGGLGNTPWLMPALLGLVAVTMAMTLRGYLAFGVTDVSFRDGLLAVLDELQLPYEESLAVIRLSTAGTDLQVAVASWIGTAQMKVKRGGQRGLLAKIARSMNAYYRHKAVPTNLTCCIVYVILGGFIALLTARFLI